MDIPQRPIKPGGEAARAFNRAWQRHFKPKRKITIEKLLTWTYRDQRVIEITGQALHLGEAVNGEKWVNAQTISGDGCVAIERNANLGCAIDGGGPLRGLPQPLHEDAETVHDAVLSMPWGHAGQLIAYGRGGLAPEPPTEPKLVRVIEHDGRRYRTKIASRYDLRMGCVLMWCPVVIDMDAKTAERARSVYQSWVGALEALLVRLDGVELRDHEVIGIGTVD
jgi:hypothetical protein